MRDPRLEQQVGGNLRTAERLRRFNRFYTRRIGLMQSGHLGSPFSLTEVRVLYEIAHEAQPTAGDITKTLGVDAGYLSRLLRGLRQRGLVSARAAPQDGRRRCLALTARGRRAFATLDARATGAVLEMLRDLTPQQQERLLASLDGVETLLGDPPPAGGESPPAMALRAPEPGDLGWVVQRHGELYSSEYGWNADFERLVAGIVAEFAGTPAGPGRQCWIATLDGRRAGCVFLMPGDAGVGRLRMLLVEPWARGRGIGARLVATCIEGARAAGYTMVTLWTNEVLVEARRLYERAGFRLTKSEPHVSFGHALVGQTWELALQPIPPS